MDHFSEIADCHALPLRIEACENLRPCSNSLTGAVYRPNPTWCVKLLEPGPVEANKFPAERAILERVTTSLPVAHILGHGVTDSRPVRVYHAYEWIEGRLWKDSVPRLNRED